MCKTKPPKQLHYGPISIFSMLLVHFKATYIYFFKSRNWKNVSYHEFELKFAHIDLLPPTPFEKFRFVRKRSTEVKLSVGRVWSSGFETSHTISQALKGHVSAYSILGLSFLTEKWEKGELTFSPMKSLWGLMGYSMQHSAWGLREALRAC